MRRSYSRLPWLLLFALACLAAAAVSSRHSHAQSSWCTNPERNVGLSDVELEKLHLLQSRNELEDKLADERQDDPSRPVVVVLSCNVLPQLKFELRQDNSIYPPRMLGRRYFIGADQLRQAVASNH